MAEPIIADVSDTALLVAAQRAVESQRPDALFRDPLAEKLAGERGRQIVARWPQRSMGAWSIAVRTVIIDDFITRSVGDGADTVLNLGAGLDTRPYRMSLPKDLRWIEVDFPHMIELKEARLANEAPGCRLERVKMDLSDLEARRRFLDEVNRSSKRVLVMTEGVVPYLSVEDVAALADDIRRMDHVDSWIVDYFSPQVFRYRRRAARALKNAPFKFRPKDWFAFFEEHGWRCGEKKFLPEEGERLGRPPPVPLAMRAFLSLWRVFGARTKLRSMRELLGYFRMVPDASFVRPARSHAGA